MNIATELDTGYAVSIVSEDVFSHIGGPDKSWWTPHCSYAHILERY